MMHTKMSRYLSRRTRGIRLLIMMCVFFIGYVCTIATTAYGYIMNSASRDGQLRVHYPKDAVIENEPLKSLSYLKLNVPCRLIASDKVSVKVGRKLMANSNESDPSYPRDVFTLTQRQHGAVVLHIFGMVYMFIALAVVCDEFFVPALGVITNKLDISEDVSGATFMAAGGSAPELFTSIIGVFIANNDVGIGTIVGSAVFNIMFVIGMCALFSSDVLALTWWPLFRDVSFYSISLLLLIGFFSDDNIEWWEALILFLSYISYVTFMKYNSKVELWLKTSLNRCKCLENKVNIGNDLLSERVGRQERSHSMPYLHSGSGHYRHGVVQLMIHTIDPVTEAKAHDKVMQMQATLQVTINPLVAEGVLNNTFAPKHCDNDMQIRVISHGKVQEQTKNQLQPSVIPNIVVEDTRGADINGDGCPDSGPKRNERSASLSKQNSPQPAEDIVPEVHGSLEETEEPLDISWPDTTRKRATYIFLAPIVLPLYVTLPDVRRQDRRIFFPWTFIGSVLWIAGYSYCMVWWASQAGETIGIPDAVMGLTVLAAGTSIPDLITSVIVAKKGFGDMAVSSSVGSNLFDITVGLPVPWLMYSAVNSGRPYVVVSKGMLCSIFLLFLMLITVIVSIAVSGWKMSKALGISMLFLYIVFVTLAVLLEYQIIVCPAT